MTFWAENSQSGSHMTKIIQILILVSLTSFMTPHPIGLPLGAAVSSLPIHLSPYAIVSLHTCFPMHSSPYVLVSLHTCLSIHLSPYALISMLHLCISQNNILLRYLSEIVYLLEVYSLSSSVVAVYGEEVELSVGHNWCSSFVWQSASSSVLAGITS